MPFGGNSHEWKRNLTASLSTYSHVMSAGIDELVKSRKTPFFVKSPRAVCRILPGAPCPEGVVR